MEHQEVDRTIQEIMKELGQACSEFLAAWEVFEADYKSKYSNKDNE